MQWLTNALSKVRAYAISFIRFERKIGWREAAVGGALVVGIVAGVSLASGGPAPVAQVEQGPREVELRSVAELSGASTPLPLVGVVRSQSEAEVRVEVSGQIIGLYRQLGDYASAGSIIAEMENSRERAALAQAQGAVDAAKASLDKVSKGVRSEQLAILNANLESAKRGLLNAILSAYSGNDEAIRRKSDQMFSSADTAAPTFNVLVADSQLPIDLQSSRAHARQILAREAAVSQTLSADADLSDEVATALAETREVRNFLDKLTAALNKAVPTTSITESMIAGYQVDANAARTSVSGSLSSLSAAAQALDVAENNLAQGQTGGQAEDVAAAQAGLAQASAGLATARANYEKTVVRAPISGTINSLLINRGDFVSAFTPVLAIANNNALEVVAYVTDRDAREISVGGKARVKGQFDAAVVRIAPALDPATKKIEVRIGLTSKSDLVNGEAVDVELARATPKATPTQAARIIIPLSALKVGTESTVVFSVDEARRLVAHPVMLGELLGDHVAIESGIDASLLVVVDARGLKAGQEVTVR